MCLWATVATGSASAETFGQIGEGWGTFGSASSQFFSPAMFGVDPNDGSVYAGDITPDGSHVRIQKLSSEGEFEASVEVPRWFNNKPVEEKILALHGIAVDHEEGRFYVIEGCRVSTGSTSCRVFGGHGFDARRILVYKATPEGEKLAPAATSSLNLPEGAEELYNPQAIAIDPANNDLVLLAENAQGNTVIQRISSAGVAGPRFVDTENILRPSPGREATSIAVGPDGKTYTLTGAPNLPGVEYTRAWELPPDLSSVKEVPGFSEAATNESWPTGLQNLRSSPVMGGPQLAISPDGETLFWKENLAESTATEPGDVLVRGFSLGGNKTSVLYGGGVARCSIKTSGAGIATTGDRLIVFDYGPEVEQGEEPPYGDKVLTFGPGGNGCPRPAAKFSVNGMEEEGVTVGKGEVVTFDASNSELLEGFRRELIWKFGDGSEKTVKFTPGTGTEPAEEAEPTVTHQYTTAGDFTVRLEVKLSEAPFGSPPAAEHTLKVEGPSEPKFKLTVSEAGSGTLTSSPGGVNCGSDCEEEYERGTVVTLIPSAAPGSEFKGWSGACTGTGTCEVTISEAKSVSAKFAPALKPKFKLTVSETGVGTVASSPSGIACEPACEAEYEEGTPVTLAAAPAEGSEFKGWGGACSGTGSCEVTMSAAKSVSAEFIPAPKLRIMLTVLRSGPGIVTSSPSGIACGAICKRGYEKGDVVKLTPVPAVA
jgi:Divergent InlB B-repeat domain/PKD domain